MPITMLVNRRCRRARHLILLTLMVIFVWSAGIEAAPGEAWTSYTVPAEAGFDPAKLAAARAYAKSIGSAAYVLVHNGIIVDTYGDVSRRYMCHSVRKSFLSALYGIHATDGGVNVDQTLEELGIDDKNELTPEERQATLRHLLKARSGVYHPAAYETPAMAEDRPTRGSHAPDTFWYYNNWDFNTLAAVLEGEIGVRMFEDFNKRIATLIGMQDFRVRDGYYHLEHHSNFPAYPFRMSSRDMARFGQLYLDRGTWNGKPILDAAWIDETRTSYSATDKPGRTGYGYMWWVLDEPLEGLDAYSALGYGGHTITVLPAVDMVFVHRTDTWVEDRVPYSDVFKLTRMLVDAQTSAPMDAPRLEPLTLDPLLDPGTNPGVAFELESLTRYVGSYPGFDNQTAEIYLEDGHLIVYLPEWGRFEASPLDDHRLLLEDWQQVVRLEEQAGGEVHLVREVK